MYKVNPDGLGDRDNDKAPAECAKPSLDCPAQDFHILSNKLDKNIRPSNCTNVKPGQTDFQVDESRLKCEKKEKMRKKLRMD